MASKFLHEKIYRGGAALAKLAELQIVVCGAGALGSHLVDNLARQGFRKIRVIDRDRVEEHNVGTQLYGAADVGAWKVEVLRHRLFRAVEIEMDAVAKELAERNVRALFKGANIVVDTFDNSASRSLVQQHCRESKFDCLHVGLYADYCEVIWDEAYRVPRDVAGDVCEYPLARNLVLLAVALASEALVRFCLEGERRSRSATLKDFVVSDVET
ncbi:MAG: ThiF family adenylyltransferase [Planctomycetota bacterium]|nr:MAG: ThiF family adenylyltransferase [Planctomycetota bacterium]REJ86915.1 MAG: ThiF family adenylyltransferase [Planctomycetota bacterium]REK26602.1 MAG: ThiF family adenylyltransferase [Planctomycetota bacterium]